jgi:hypothetical protein
MTKALSFILFVAAVSFFAPPSAQAYPPAVGILGGSRSCVSCHASNGPWADEEKTLVDILDAKTKTSLKQEDGSFLIEVGRGQARTVLSVIGRPKGETSPPHRNAWLYVDPTQLKTSALSKFAPGWDVNLPMSCRIVGDAIEGYDGAYVTVLPMTVRPSDAARDTELELQVMITAGESVKGKAKEGLVSNYLVRKVLLQVRE